MSNGQIYCWFIVYGYALKPYEDPTVVAENLERASYDPNSTTIIAAVWLVWLISRKDNPISEGE